MNYKFYDNILLPCARVLAKTVGGSGTIIYSKKTEEEYASYILTNHHVIAELIDVKEAWDSLLKRKIEKEFTQTARIHFFRYKWESRNTSYTAIEADIVAYDREEDLALLKLRSGEAVPGMAKLYPKGEEKHLRIGDNVICLGCGLLEPPVFTQGRLSLFNREIENKSYLLSTAPSIYGNSGGSLYLEKTGELIGVPARIGVVGFLGIDAITHLSYAIPITRIYSFLENQFFRFIFSEEFTETGEEAERKKRREQEKLRLLAEGASKDSTSSLDPPGWQKSA